MIVALAEVTAAVLVTALVTLLPGIALIAALRAWAAVPALLRPAAALLGSVAIAAAALLATLLLERSIIMFATLLGGSTLALGVIALLRWKPGRREHATMRRGLRVAAPYALPGLLVSAIAAIDSPHVRSDTFWHVALARRLADIDHLSSAAIAFEAGASGNANYPLPAWHALVALADQFPRVDAWSATWFSTIWLAPVAMLAFGAMASVLVGSRRAALAGCWAFVAIVVLGYGPWFMAVRYLAYPGQVAIYALLPIAVVAVVASLRAPDAGARAAQLLWAAAATAGIGVLHGNYVLYPALFAGGGAALLLLGRREGRLAAVAATAAVTAAGALVLAAQLPWLRADDNFLRGAAAPRGEPTAFVRHRDVLVGNEASFHVELGSFAAQPWLVAGTLAIPVVLLLRRRRPGPWVLAGGAVAIALFARAPWVVELLDRIGSVTPVTRFDRVYPAAVGTVGIALGVGWLAERAWQRGRHTGAGVTAAMLAVVAVATAGADSIRDTRRIVVTPFVEARWVGGLDPSGLPRVAVVVASLAIVAVAIWIRVRVPDPTVSIPPDRPRDRRYLVATLVMVAVAAGLAPTSIARLQEAWQPQAYRQSARDDRRYERIEVYPASARAALLDLEPGSVVLAGFNDIRRIASLAPVQSVEESVLRELVAEPPAPGAASSRLDELVDEWQVGYVVANRFDRSFAPLLDAAERAPDRYVPIEAGPLRMFRVRDRGRGDA